MKAFWFESLNFGDALSPVLIERLSGECPRNVHPRGADLVGAGSVLFAGGALFFERRRWSTPYGLAKLGLKALDGLRPPLKIWGSGFLYDPGFKDVIHVRKTQVLAVRGALTLSILKRVGIVRESEMTGVALGDPGLLYPSLVGSRPEVCYDVGVVPHFRDKEYGRALEQKLADGGLHVRLVDVMQKDPLNVVREIGACERILSSSLHGLIVADAWGIPRRHVLFSNLGQRDQDVLFKFKDYGSAVADDWRDVVTGAVALENPLETVRSVRLVSRDAVANSIGRLLETFPYHHNHGQ